MVNPLLNRWVPVLVSLVFGQTTGIYEEHWKYLLENLGDEINSSWETFQQRFVGTTVAFGAPRSTTISCECGMPERGQDRRAA
jgi:hypothetical protein